MYLFFNIVDNSNGDDMAKKITTISVLVISVILVSLYVISSTYSVIINVIGRNGEDDIIQEITIRDILTDSNGNYNSIYYDGRRELNISYDEGETIIDSVLLNDALKTIIEDVVGYKLHNKTRMSDIQIYNLIVKNVRLDNTISDDVKDKIIDKAWIYIDDIVKYVYDFDIEMLS